MQNPNPNPTKNSTPTNNKSPQDPPSDDESSKVTNPTILQSAESMKEEEVLQTALEVLVEFRARENGRLAADGEGGSDDQAMKRRKNNIREVKDNPLVYPTCPRCKHLFPTWAATLKHMEYHSAPQPVQYEGDDESQPMEIEEDTSDAESESSEDSGLGFDLNELPPSEEE